MKSGKKRIKVEDDSSASSDMFAQSDGEQDNTRRNTKADNAGPPRIVGGDSKKSGEKAGNAGPPRIIGGADVKGGLDDDISVGSTSSTEDITIPSSQYVQKRIAKTFKGDGIFFGTVIQCIRRIDRKREKESSKMKQETKASEATEGKDCLYSILYDDGDAEEMDLPELKRALLLYELKRYRDPKRQEDAELPAEDLSHAKCDICMKAHNHVKMKLLTCLRCEVSVHGDCYGLPTYQERDFVCWACQSVGQEIPIEDVPEDSTEAKQDEYRCIKQRKRPWICELCHHNPVIDNNIGGDWDLPTPHAMHPLYDTHGLSARQKVVVADVDKHGQPLEKPKKRLAWAHSLCAFMLSKHNLLYGVQANGTTHDGVEEDDTDERPPNIYLRKVDQLIQDDGDYGEAAPLHHFVYPTKRIQTQLRHPPQSKTGDTETDDTKRTTRSASDPNAPTRTVRQKMATVKALQLMEEYKTQTCCLCKPEVENGNDNSGTARARIGGKLQIPIQCSANDADEYKKYRFTHRSTLKDDEVCTVPMHVGCARWGSSIRALGTDEAAGGAPKTRVLFFPGNDTHPDPVKLSYCALHAKDMSKKSREEAKQREEEQMQESRSKRKSAFLEKYGEDSATLAGSKEETGKQENMKKKPKRLSVKKPKSPEEQLEAIKKRLEKEVANGLIETVGALDDKEERSAELKRQKKRWRRVAADTTSDLADNLPPEWFDNIWKTAKEELVSVVLAKNK